MIAAARLTAIRYAPMALDLELAPANFLPTRVRDVLSELVANPSAVDDEALQELKPELPEFLDTFDEEPDGTEWWCYQACVMIDYSIEALINHGVPDQIASLERWSVEFADTVDEYTGGEDTDVFVAQEEAFWSSVREYDDAVTVTQWPAADMVAWGERLRAAAHAAEAIMRAG
jgi:hypothetical protein